MAGANSNHSPQLHEAIRRRAEEIYRHSGEAQGCDLENWHRAEAELLRELASTSARRAIVIKFQGVVYTGEYESASAGGYAPGEFAKGAPVPVRFEGDKMFVKRPNGGELETRIVTRA